MFLLGLSDCSTREQSCLTWIRICDLVQIPPPHTVTMQCYIKTPLGRKTTISNMLDTKDLVRGILRPFQHTQSPLFLVHQVVKQLEKHESSKLSFTGTYPGPQAPLKRQVSSSKFFQERFVIHESILQCHGAFFVQLFGHHLLQNLFDYFLQ